MIWDSVISFFIGNRVPNFAILRQVICVPYLDFKAFIAQQALECTHTSLSQFDSPIKKSFTVTCDPINLKVL